MNLNAGSDDLPTWDIYVLVTDENDVEEVWVPQTGVYYGTQQLIFRKLSDVSPTNSRDDVPVSNLKTLSTLYI